MDTVLRQEMKLNNQYSHMRRMTAKEHCDRVRFDHYLVDAYIPDNKYKRIYPLDAGQGGFAANGDELEELYAKIEKTANIVWKKQVGTI